MRNVARWIMMVVVVAGIAAVASGCNGTTGDKKADPPKDHPAH